MKKETFYKLHSLLEDNLRKYFFPDEGGTRDTDYNAYLIKTEIRLSIALRYFAGGCPYDLMLTHGVSFCSVFTSIWGVVNVVNKYRGIKIEFPSLEEQVDIAKEFEEKSGAGFDNVIGAIDGILIWLLKPSKNQCEKAGGAKSKSFFVQERINLV